MPIFELKNIPAEFARAVNAADLDALVSLYEADAVFVTGPGASPAVTGSGPVREVLSGFLASRPTMELEHAYVYETGGIAVARGKWKLTSTGADGSAPSRGRASRCCGGRPTDRGATSSITRGALSSSVAPPASAVN